MADIRHKAYSAAIATALSTELNSLANNAASAASAAIDNSSALDLMADLTLTLATQGTARNAGATVVVYLIPATDGTNYDDALAAGNEIAAVFSLDAATTARQLTRRDVAIPPGQFKLMAVNLTGQALAASGNLLEYRPHSLQSA